MLRLDRHVLLRFEAAGLFTSAALLAWTLGGCVADTTDSHDSSEAAISSATPSGTGPGLALSVHTTLGIPEAASPSDPRHALLVKRQYVASFDSVRKNPRWTSWELTTAWLGSTPRSPSFVPDPSLPAGMKQATQTDYSHSGYERGHICPSGDRTDSSTDNAATFLYTNVVPQTAASNTGPWESLESEERSLAKAGNHLFIVAGSIYGNATTIGDGVAVPTSMFKVVVVMQGAHPAPADVTTTTRVITIEVPNTNTVNGPFGGYRTSFGAIEAKTGFRFVSDVATSVHDALAAEVDAE